MKSEGIFAWSPPDPTPWVVAEDAPVAIARVELDIFCNHAHPDYDRASENLEASCACVGLDTRPSD